MEFYKDNIQKLIYFLFFYLDRVNCQLCQPFHHRARALCAQKGEKSSPCHPAPIAEASFTPLLLKDYKPDKLSPNPSDGTMRGSGLSGAPSSHTEAADVDAAPSPTARGGVCAKTGHERGRAR